MNPKTKILVYVILLLLVDSIPLPLPVTALILFFVVLQRPVWFSEMYQQVYK